MKYIASASVALSMLLTGCAHLAQQQMVWVPSTGATMTPVLAEARCDYETSAATQGTDYTMRSVIGQELDRAMRKQDLYAKCMRANGFVLQQVASLLNAPADPKWAALEGDLELTKKHRARIRANLTANPTTSNAQELSAEITSLNAEVAELERKLSYAPTPPISASPSP